LSHVHGLPHGVVLGYGVGQTTMALVRLAADPEAMDEYRAESASIAEADVAVVDW
jgi:hypothetical protein